MTRSKGYVFKKCTRCGWNFRAASKTTNYCRLCSGSGMGNHKRTPMRRSKQMKDFLKKVKEVRDEEVL